jgi:hypothetical protein
VSPLIALPTTSADVFAVSFEGCRGRRGVSVDTLDMNETLVADSSSSTYESK